MTNIIPFDFEEHAVRVIMRDTDPWFVAADICRVLELKNPSMVVKGLDDDEVTLSIIEGSHRKTNIINESGLYALVLTSRKETAKRFRKWITAEVLPSIRRTGRYDHILPDDPQIPFASETTRDAELWLSMIREARLLGGTKAGRTMWERSPLPQLFASPSDAPAKSECLACLAHLISVMGHEISDARLGNADAIHRLSQNGMRIKQDGLFVANAQATGIGKVFLNTNWVNSGHINALRGLAGVLPSPCSYSLNATQSRGLIVPFDLLNCKMMEAANA